MTKLFDSNKNRWKTDEEVELERDLSRNEQLKKSVYDMTVNFSFSVNDVMLNSGLNADVLEALEFEETTGFDLVQPFVADYELNQRQIVIYMI